MKGIDAKALNSVFDLVGKVDHEDIDLEDEEGEDEAMRMTMEKNKTMT